ncbi:MAG: winged helix-turn-helix transcriptional regulator [Nanoarchaeota archaeon]
MKLDEKDLKLLGYLYHSNREPFTKIAKATGLSRIQVEYKFNKFIKEGYIKKFMTMLNYSLLGYPIYALLLIKLEKFSSLNIFTRNMEKTKNCISWAECFGRYDIFSNLIFKSEEEMSKFLSNLINNESGPVSEYIVVKPYLAEFYSLKIFYDKQKPLFSVVYPHTKERKLDEKDISILKLLEEDNRIRIIDIAKKTGMSAELVLYKLKKLEEDGVILGCKAFLSMKKLGYNYSIIILNIKNLSEEIKNKIITFARSEKKVNALVLSLFNPNCLIQIFHKTDDELKEEIRKIKELMKYESVDIEILLAQEEDKINTLPFLK